MLSRLSAALLLLAEPSLVPSSLIHQAHAHSWYPPICCSERDCASLSPGSVEEGPGGYLIRSTGEFIPKSEARDGRDEDFHVCRNPAGVRLCFFIPARGS